MRRDSAPARKSILKTSRFARCAVHFLVILLAALFHTKICPARVPRRVASSWMLALTMVPIWGSGNSTHAGSASSTTHTPRSVAMRSLSSSSPKWKDKTCPRIGNCRRSLPLSRSHETTFPAVAETARCSPCDRATALGMSSSGVVRSKTGSPVSTSRSVPSPTIDFASREARTIPRQSISLHAKAAAKVSNVATLRTSLAIALRIIFASREAQDNRQYRVVSREGSTIATQSRRLPVKHQDGSRIPICIG